MSDRDDAQTGPIKVGSSERKRAAIALGVLAELFGEQEADAVQLATEYDPQPARAVGRPELATPELVERVRAQTQARQERRSRVSAAAAQRLRGIRPGEPGEGNAG